jgi:asparagine synthase (glutamine-hydrolysing)
MCGICGTVGRVDEHELSVMTDALAHRGPDGRGTQVFDGDLPAGLGHRRLAIIDPSPAGAQPMVHDDRWWITYNGELYNFPELRAELVAKGERMRTHCDTEVLLRLFALEGPAMLQRINGIFAFAIWDERDKRLFVARDRMGVKPLYYVERDGTFAFASELRALLPLLGTAQLDHRGLADYLTFLWVPEPRTAFVGVQKLPAGHFAWVDRDGTRIERFWDLEIAPEERPEQEWRDSVAETVAASVKRQLLADVPVGSFLSGGIDSSAIVAAMAEEGGIRPRTYTIGFEKADLREEIVPDDVRHARRVATDFATDHHEIMLHPDVLSLLPKAVWHLEEPVADPAAISTYLICREAGQTMPVMLSGVGGDEMFAGYPRHLAYRISRLLDGLPGGARGALEQLATPIGRPGGPGRLRGPRRNLWKYMRASGKAPMERYLSYLTYYPEDQLHSILAPDVARELNGHDPRAGHRRHLQAAEGLDELATLLYLDSKTFLPNLNLTYTDKMSMAASVEVRVPLLDDEMVALASRIPSEYKLRGRHRKYIFKRSQEGRLPHRIIWRAKAGFGAPVRSWLSGELSPMVEELLSESTMRERGLVDPEAVGRLRAQNDSGDADYSLQLYSLLNLELWCRQWTDQPWTWDRVARESAAVPKAR